MQCKICTSTATNVLYAAASDYITGESFEVWECSACGAAFTKINTTDFSPYYPQQYRRYSPAILKLLKTLYRTRTQRWSSLFTQPGFAFEMGCGDGFMLLSLRNQGWRVLGNERTAEMLTIARQQFNLPVFAGEPDALQPEPTFDMIILFQVLEHLPDPVATLTTLSARLKPGGRVIISVPDRASWQARFGRERWFHLDVPRHLFHYTPAALETALRHAGLQTEQVYYVSPEHDPFGWVQTLLSKLDTRPNRLTRLLMRIDNPSVTSLLQLMISVILGGLSLPLSLLSWILRRGAIMEVVARKVSSS